MRVKEEIVIQIKKALSGLGIEIDSVQLEIPQDQSHGDYFSNIALVTSQKLHQSTMEIAQKIKDKMVLSYPVEKIEVVKPGFINFWLSKDYFISQLQEVLEQQEKFGMTAHAQFGNRKIMVEFTDPNPFKEFHIGHLYSNVVGEAICRLLEANGALVKRANYQGDVGMHVAKAIYGLKNHESRIMNHEIDEESISKRIKILGEAYTRGAKAYEEDETAKKEIIEINKKIYEQDSSIMELYSKGREWSLEYFETIYKRLGTKFDFYYFESEAGKVGLKYVQDNLKSGIFEQSEGAIIFPGGKYGLHNRVFINSLGLPTYEAKEIGLAPKKYKDFPYDLSIIVTGNEINEYFKVLLKALSLLNPELAAKTKHLGHGMVRLPEGKMSSRTGNVITGEWLLDEAKNKIKKTFKEVDQNTTEQIAVGAVKYALLKSGIGKDISFSFEESVSLEGNSGPYLQYTYARTRSVLRRSTSVIPNSFRNLGSDKMLNQVQHDKQLQPEEILLLRLLHRFPEVVQGTAESFALNLLCSYLFDLAQKFNLFYQKHKILDAEAQRSTDSQGFRVALTEATGHVIKNGLYLLGIVAPDRM